MSKRLNSGQSLRLQVALARLGFASRRAAAQLIRSGEVKINDRVALEPGHKVNLKADKISVAGRIRNIQKKTYLMLNKPRDVVTTLKDRYAKKTVFDFIPQKNMRLYPVGRLDKDTTGLLLLTNDGEMAYGLTHPKFGVKKVYRVQIKGRICPEKVKRLEKGIVLEGRKTFPCQIKILSFKKDITHLEVVLTEGRKRQIRKMFLARGHPVLAIKRIGLGRLKLGRLEQGCCRELSQSEIRQLQNSFLKGGLFNAAFF